METRQPDPPSGTPVHPARRRTLIIGLLAGALLLGMLAGLLLTTHAPNASPTQRAGAPLALTILHTNDTWGYLLPCG